MYDEITYSFTNFTVATAWEWISNFVPYFDERVIAYPCQV